MFPYRTRILQLLVYAAAIGWGVAILGTLLPWNVMEFLLQGLGKEMTEEGPMVRYWFRMASGGWSIMASSFSAVPSVRADMPFCFRCSPGEHCLKEWFS